MKMLFWTPLFWPDIGGIELISMRLIQSLRSWGHDIAVLTSHGRIKAPDLSFLDGTPIYRFPIIAAFENQDLLSLMGIQKEIREIKQTYNPDIEHLNFGGPAPIGFFYLRAAQIAPAPLILTLRASVHGLDGSSGSITGEVLRAARWVTGVSQAILNDASELVPEINGKSSVVYNGIEESSVQPAPLPFNPVRILCLGRLEHEKGFDLAIEAFAKYVEKFPKTQMIIAGDGSDRLNLERQVSELHLSNVVKFLRAYKHEEVYELINKATLVIVPTRVREAFGQVALEASQMARPAIASNIGGLSEVVINGETGILVKPDNSQAIYEAMVWMIENSNKAIQMGKNGYNRAHTFFSWDRCVNNFDRLYKNFGKKNDE